MTTLYREVEYIDGETAEPVQYVGVYVLRWRSKWGEPTIAFVPDDDATDLREQRDELLKACNAALEAICAGAESWMLADVEAKCRAAIASVTGADEQKDQ